jgi:hypothetical protein
MLSLADLALRVSEAFLVKVTTSHMVLKNNPWSQLTYQSLGNR